ncbi:hypothetical protein [Alicyclobacillus kakegawensis]|uniref:hypothetical protein n=1 Tax=Alicyclobacillus kakegawensis TaxID=392012 RepID=UPI000836A68A|nr:hypothetical protein [Alicyclobacillus kakegawensis]
MTLAHWVYLLGALVVVATMVFRKNLVVPSLVFTFLVAWAHQGSVIAAVESIFNADLYAATQLFNVFLIISIMVAMLRAAHHIGADVHMVRPIQKLMRTPLVAYTVLVLATAAISLFFWPTPAIPLVGALLIPTAVRAGLSPLAAAAAVALAGQGMALAGDVVIQGAPSITASAAGVPLTLLLVKGGILTGVTGAVAIPLAYLMQRQEIRQFHRQSVEDRMQVAGMLGDSRLEMAATAQGGPNPPLGNLRAAVCAIVVPVLLLAAIAALCGFHLKGGDATALLGGVGSLLLVILGLVGGGRGTDALERVSQHLVEGFTFSFRAMGPVIPIAGFFYLGSPDGAQAILGKGAPGFLFDAAVHVSHALPPGSVAAAFGVLLLGLVTGLDGSGFAGLPLVGSVAGALAPGNPQTASLLGAIGQMGSVWSGGGTLIAWSSLVAVAAVAGVNVSELAKRNLVPVLVGLVVSTVVGLILW